MILCSLIFSGDIKSPENIKLHKIIVNNSNKKNLNSIEAVQKAILLNIASNKNIPLTSHIVQLELSVNVSLIRIDLSATSPIFFKL